VYRALVLLVALQVSAPAQEKRREIVVVTGTYEPVPLEEADRSVRVFDVRSLELVTNSFADLLKLDSSVDMRQRAPNTVQSDVSIRGGGFGQTLVLVDGIRVNDVQSGHHNFDVPVPLESLEQIEVLKGSGSTFYGSDAIGGVVNFITRKPEATEVRLRAAAGNFGVNQQRGTLSYASPRFAQHFSASRDFSSGFIPNRDYRNLSLASATHLTSALGVTAVLLAANDRPFGAEQFYGDFNSWERTRTWFASARQSLGERTTASFAFRRHTDVFVLYRDRPDVFTNRHAAESFQAALRRHEDLWPSARLHYGVEGYRDSISSNNLGQHDRARGAGYIAFDVRALRRFSVSAGVRDEVHGSGDHEISPTLSFGAWLSPEWKVRASASRAFRLPTFTDLYYHDPANRGSPDLRPERGWSYESGIDWNPRLRVRVSATVFHRRERDVIDYIRQSQAEIWRAANFQRLHFTGFEASVSVREVELHYTGLRGAQAALAGYLSKYVFNYPVHAGIAGWNGMLWDRIAARTRIGVVQRFTRDPYAVWDVFLAASHSRLRPFLQATNLVSTRYEEIPRVAMPGRGIVAGLDVIVWTAR
jgi:iron complex outermembrane receptor protein